MPGAGITAERLGMTGPRGPVFENVDVQAPPGSLVAVEGPSGSGRTCLLLALTGRMRVTSGTARVGGHPLPKKMAAVRAVSALGPVPGVTDLDPALTVAEQLRERSLLRRYLRGWRLERNTERRARIRTALDLVGLDPEALPRGLRTTVRDLERLEELRLGLALALLDGPRLLAVDDLDMKLSDAERASAWELLRTIAESGVTVLAVCSQAPPDALVVRTGARGEDRTEDEADAGTDGEVATDAESEDNADADDNADARPGADANADADANTDDNAATAKGEADDALAEARRA
ncbi:ATP-binding cassette domain-containing protein [Streptomyces sp. OF3]|uniref:ATP-binding cassette domain-containing protein n=1 Tax=Streptomyces alkaliterrae TaxID=2213162 RepID=A0A7W3WQ13_9ACTN|nr:ATP-binding cassette domain-containing protein [Streptomyces alkaliterrae]MBB1256205.1 ATP-binding cassette domain-containing protein [Streptomyces alkaliterrae]